MRWRWCFAPTRSVITLLVLEIRLPAGADLADHAALPTTLLALWPKSMYDAMSFLVIGLDWREEIELWQSNRGR